MAFTMAHLIISQKISKIFDSHIKNLPQFYLGTIAPDAVHNRANYISEYKKASHLIAGPEQWGFTTDNDGWLNNTVALLSKYKLSENHDFVLGYCCHILSDMYKYKNIWTPFRLKHADELEKGLGNILYQENNKVDIEMALTYEDRNEFWRHLANSNSLDFADIIYAAEIDKQKDNILNSWYKDKERQDISSNKIVTYEREMDYVKNATDFVALIFRDNLLKPPV